MNSYIIRAIEPIVMEIAAQYPVITILGPRQSPKRAS